MKYLSYILFLTVISFGCEKNDCCDVVDGNCDDVLIHDSALFDSAPDDPLTINSAKVEGDCLNISFSYGGGCKDTDVKLIASEIEGLSMPPFKSLRLSLNDQDDCEAWVTVERSFDLSILGIGDQGEYALHLQGWDALLSYKY